MNTLLSSVARGRLVAGAVAAAAAAGLTPLSAQADTGKLLLTGGVSTIEGAAGGGLSPWAVIGSQASGGEIGVAAYASRAVTDDYALTGYGVAVGLHDRFELSLAHQKFSTGDRLGGLNPALSGLPLKQDIFGAKYRIAGDAVLDSDNWMPQIAVGIQHKRLAANAFTEGVVEGVLGAKRSGTDVYVSATKLFLAQGLLVNGTLRASKANQNGLLGFGFATDNSYDLQPEISVAYLLRKDLAVGFEYRGMNNKLKNALANQGLAADDWKDIFIAWAPSKNLSLTAAYVDLGRVAPALTANRKQRGAYLSAQLAF